MKEKGAHSQAQGHGAPRQHQLVAECTLRSFRCAPQGIVEVVAKLNRKLCMPRVVFGVAYDGDGLGEEVLDQCGQVHRGGDAVDDDHLLAAPFQQQMLGPDDVHTFFDVGSTEQ